MELSEAVKLHRSLRSLLTKAEKVRKTTSHGPTADMLKNTVSTLHEALYQLGQSEVK